MNDFMPTTSLTTAAIRRYYEQNTTLFQTFATASHTYTIHRAVWADGITTAAAALNYTNERLLVESQALTDAALLAPLRFVDLGCGIGGSLFYLLARLPSAVQGIGITLSPRQACLAHQRARQLALAGRCCVLEGDFQAVPLTADTAHLVYSLEAFVHALEPARYFAQAARLLKSGGRLVLCDDFLAPTAELANRREAQAWLQAYRQGWHAPNLLRVDAVAALAAAWGLQLCHDEDLTPALRLHTMPTPLARLICRLGNHFAPLHAIIPSLTGSLALQHCLQLGLIHYRFLVFERRP